MKKRKTHPIKTILPTLRPLVTFIITIFILLVLILFFRGYSSLVEEKPIEVRTQDDLEMAKQSVQQQVQALKKEVGDLRALVT